MKLDDCSVAKNIFLRRDVIDPSVKSENLAVPLLKTEKKKKNGHGSIKTKRLIAWPVP